METYVHRTQMPQLPATGTRGQDSPPFIQNYEKIVLYPSATILIIHLIYIITKSSFLYQTVILKKHLQFIYLYGYLNRRWILLKRGELH
jgi:hypothetical protein